MNYESVSLNDGSQKLAKHPGRVRGYASTLSF